LHPGKSRIPHEQYSEKVASGYNFRFGQELPFAPGNPELQGGGFIQPGAFPDAKYCAHCHQEAYHQLAPQDDTTRLELMEAYSLEA
jgi:hypothetical protein